MSQDAAFIGSLVFVTLSTPLCDHELNHVRSNAIQGILLTTGATQLTLDIGSGDGDERLLVLERRFVVGVCEVEAEEEPPPPRAKKAPMKKGAKS